MTHPDPRMANPRTNTDIPPVERPTDLKWIGKSVKRVEDPKFLRGIGKYVADLEFHGMLHAAVVRSPYAHARIASVDIAAAKEMPGVRGVVTGAEAAELIDPLPDSGPAP